MNTSKKVVILGSGFAGIYGALSVYKNCGKDVSITIINRTNYFLFTPMLHEVATGGLGYHQIVESIREIVYKKKINFIEANILSVDVANKKVLTDGVTVEYDVLVIATGATTNFFGTPGAEENSFVLKNLHDAIQIRDRIIDIFEAASKETDTTKKRAMLSFVVVGGGATGVEIISEIAELCSDTLKQYYKDKIGCDDITISLINSAPELLSVFDPKIRAYAQKILEKNSIKILLNTKVSGVTKAGVTLGDGTLLASETVIWSAGVKPNEIVTTGGELPKDKGGRIVTSKTFQVVGLTDVFAVGDVSHFDESSERGLPMLAQVAVMQGKLLGKNIHNFIHNKSLVNFVYKSKGEFVSLGHGEATGVAFGVHVYGRLAWFMWRTIYLFKFISKSKRVRIVFDWTMQLFSNRDITRAS
ncbi:MAG: NAD(P)/FAD-dependent oxidoreductase [bacterium]